MRIVAVADTHLFHEELLVPPGDVFVHAGDLCQRGTLEELADVAEWIRSLPHPIKIVVAGNHDWPFVRNAPAARHLLGPSINYLEDSGLELEGLKVWGSPWQPRFGSFAFNLDRGAPLAEKWALIPENIDILITHGPPQGIGDLVWRGENVGCGELLKRVRAIEPRLHIFGHIHEAGGAWVAGRTLFANATTWEGDRGPTVIDFDRDTKDARAIVVPATRR